MTEPSEPESRETVRDLFRGRGTLPALNRVTSRQGAGPASTEAIRDAEADEPRARNDYVTVKADLQERVVQEMQRRNLLGAGEEALTTGVQDFVAEVLATEDLPLTEGERDHLARELVEEALGIGPLAPLMADPAITDILVNRFDQVYIERFGRLERTNICLLYTSPSPRD